MKTFDVICPVFNEQQTIPLFFQRIEGVFSKLSSQYQCRLIFVDNCSTDSSVSIIKDLASRNNWIGLLSMSRNFGYQCSVECGLRNSTADLTSVVDVDCEDPPELFIDFLKHIEEGYDVVYGERKDREESSLLKGLRKLYYRVTSAAADENFILDMAEFCVMNQMVREAVLSDTNSFPFIRASIGRVGFSIKNFPYKRHKRIAGETHYNFWRMSIFGIAGILSSSTMWLRSAAYIFPFWAVAIVSLISVYQFWDEKPIYLYSFFTLSFLFIGFVLTGMSIYLARVYKNGLNRPNYFINHKKTIFWNQKAK